MELGELNIHIGDGNYSSKYPKNSEFLEEGVPFISASDFQGRVFIADGMKYISEEQHSVLLKGHLKPRDILVVVRGNGCGKVGFVPAEYDNANINAQLALLRCDNQTVNSEYLYYLLSTNEYQNKLKALCSGSAQPQLPIKSLKKLQLELPKYEMQLKIAGVAKIIDDKMLNNAAINRNLHEQLNALYSNQFEPYVMSEDIPEGWTFVTLGEVAEVKNGCAFKGSDFTENGTVPVIKIKNVKPYKILLNSVDYVNEETVVGKDKFKIKHGDLLITMTGNRMDGSPDSWVGKVAVFDVYGNYYLNQRVGIIAPDTTKISTYYLSEFLSSWTMQKYFIERATSSGGQANISPDIIKSIAFAIPSKKEMEEFEGLAKVYYLQIAKNQDEIDKLISLRDSLLPKLMSGELDISDFDI